jgi:hypothetical protein
MGQPDATRAFHSAFSALNYSYVSYPNGPELNTSANPIPADTLWYALDVLSSKPKVVGSGTGITRYKGIFQVTIRAPVKSAKGNPFGTYAIYASAEVIAIAFKLATSLLVPDSSPSIYAHCEEPETIDLGKLEPEWYAVVVRIPYWMDE